MTNQAGRQWAEVVGVLGVMASLVFVGLEVRESSRATRAATDAEIAAQFVDLNTAMFSSPEIIAAIDASTAAGHPSLTSTSEQATLLAFYRSVFHIWSNAHRQHLSGTVNPLLFEAVVGEISTYSAPTDSGGSDRLNRRRAEMQWAWEAERFIYNAAFRAFVDSVMHAPRNN
jgi:hypothetical protein